MIFCYLKQMLTGKVYAFQKPIYTFGSDKEADIVVTKWKNPLIMGHFVVSPKQVILYVTQSQVPVCLNQKPIQQAILKEGDQLEIAGDLFAFSFQAIKEPALEHASSFHAYEQLLNFSRKLSKKNNILDLLNELMDFVIDLSKAEKGFLVLLEKQVPVIQVARNMKKESLEESKHQLSDSIIQKVLASKQSILVTDALNHQEFSHSLSVVNLRLISVMCVPLVWQGEILGAIYLGNNTFQHQFDELILRTMEIFAAQASLLVQHAFQIQALKHQLEQVKLGGLLGNSEAMRQIFSQIQHLKKTQDPILIMGEPGTGKGMLAKEIHLRAGHPEETFLRLNCALFEISYLQEELKKNAIETVFLDELTHLNLDVQKQLCELLKSKQFVNIRLIASANWELYGMVKKKLFFEALLYELKVIELSVPPLRERGNDILLLAHYFFEKYKKLYEKSGILLSKEAENLIYNYSWPGNLVQLENRIRRAVVMCEGSFVTESDLDLPKEGALLAVLPLSEAVERFKYGYVQSALERYAGNRTQAAKELGVDPRTIFRYLETQKKSEINI